MTLRHGAETRSTLVRLRYFRVLTEVGLRSRDAEVSIVTSSISGHGMALALLDPQLKIKQ